MEKQLLPYVEVNPSRDAVGSVIWLHGLGADGYDFESIVPALHLPESLPLRFIFPHAPVRPVTINMGMAMRAWYDVVAIDPNVPEDETGIIASSQEVDALIKHEIERGIPAEKIILAGFSQGGAIALYAGLRYPKKLGGIIALSTYLPLAKKLVSESSDVNHDVPIFMAHGTMDTIVPLPFAKQSEEHLQSLNYHVEWHTYPMTHSTCMEEVVHLRKWLCARHAITGHY